MREVCDVCAGVEIVLTTPTFAGASIGYLTAVGRVQWPCRHQVVLRSCAAAAFVHRPVDETAAGAGPEPLARHAVARSDR